MAMRATRTHPPSLLPRPSPTQLTPPTCLHKTAHLADRLTNLAGSTIRRCERNSTSMPLQIASFSIAARATLDMHSLNNEGGEGNQIQTRMVDIVGADGRMHNVNAISGDMLKHIQGQHFFELARSQGLLLCAGCQHFDANRV